jgi:DNA-binding transcriptional ArsR family regulator
MAIKQKQHLQFSALAALLHSFSDPTRLSIIYMLSENEARVADLVDQLGFAQSTISAHISCLKECGLVEGRHEGRQIFYNLTSPNISYLLHDAELILEQTDQAVMSCPIFGDES